MVAALAGDDDIYNHQLDDYASLEEDPNTRREVAESFSKAFGELSATTITADRPVIGDVYEEIGTRSDRLGQYFTPWNLCQLKAELITAGKDHDQSGDPVTISDPACGSGRLLIAEAKRLHEEDPETPVIATGVDKDRTCARMAVINLAIAGVPGRIHHGDSLSMDFHRTWLIDPTTAGPTVKQVEPPEVSEESDADDARQATL
ncbi:N-6 DNA methylase [Halorubrum sp. ASP1]|uniref:N-6 DNA methylase n=1 Tax=Halorubrum sp. ASP1 TaxID=2518114 RepID=UPI0013051ED7|nr:N-6 DNA methylase [Halorubrum sp. ASP1]